MLLLLLAAALAGVSYAYARQRAVTGALLEQFAPVDTALRIDNQRMAREATAILREIIRAVVANELQRKDVEVLHRAQLLTARTTALADSLRAWRTLAPAEPAAGPLEEAPPAALAAQLNSYVAFVRRWVPDMELLTQPAVGSAASDWFKNTYFQNMPTHVQRTTLTRLEAQVRRAGAEALAVEARQVGSSCHLCFWHYEAMAIPAADTVAPGETYRARLSLTSRVNNPTATTQIAMQANGRPLARDSATGYGLVRLPVPDQARPGLPDTVAASWRGSIRLRRHFIPDTVWHLRVPYSIISRPAL